MKPVSHRQFLHGTAGAGTVLLPRSARAVLNEPHRVDNIIAPSTVTEWQEHLVQFGTRYTGSGGQDRFVDFLAAELERMKLEVRIDRIPFNRWEATRWNLREVNGPDIPLSSYYPYSGETPEAGITAEIVYCGVQEAPDAFTRPDGSTVRDPSDFFAPAAGKIALVDAPIPDLASGTFYSEPGFYPERTQADWPETLVNPLFQGNANPVDLVAAGKRGVRGVVCAWTNASDEAANFQYNPFKTPYQGLPAVWITRSTAQRVKELAARGSEVTLTLSASKTAGAVSNTIWCTVPGRNSDEKLIVNTHTDGGNAIEENGGLGLLVMADYFTRLPRGMLARDIVFVFATGHFQQPQFTVSGGYGATSHWKADHPEIWEKAVAGITVEHLGCLEWSDRGGTQPYAATGEKLWSQAFTSSAGAESPTSPERGLYLDAAAANAVERAVAMSSPRPETFLGEGKQFFADRIPLVSLIPLPTWLLRAGPDLELGKVDGDLMYAQIKTMLTLAENMQKLPAAAFRGR